MTTSVARPVRLPHFQRRGSEVYFLISRRATFQLLPDEVSLFDAIDGLKTVEELTHTYPAATEALRRWIDANVVILIPPHRVTSDRPRLVVVEPHSDDAILSTGGRLLQRRYTHQITILAVATRSTFTSYSLAMRPFADERAVTELRQAESEMVARVLGATYQSLDLPEALVRFGNHATAKIAQHTLASFERMDHPPSSEESAMFYVALREALVRARPDELWIPLGVGGHVDHQLTRDTCLAVIAAEPAAFARTHVSLYEDLPYVVDHPHHAERIAHAFGDAGTSLARVVETIDDQFEDKLRLVSCYASQFKMSVIGPKLRTAARLGARGTLEEASYRLDGMPRPPAPVTLRLRRTGDRALDRWFARRDHCDRVIVVADKYFGAFSLGMDVLARAFPRARITVLVPPFMSWETAGFSHERVQIASSLPRDLPQRVTIGALTIILESEHGAVGRPRISELLAPQDPLVFHSFGDLSAALLALLSHT